MSTESFKEVLFRSRLVSSVAAGLGVFLILVAGGVLVFIEGMAINKARSLEQGAAVVVSIKPEAVEAANNGKLVHLTGEATTTASPADDDFGISAPALRLSREVEIYQWKETKSDVKKDKETTTKYTYKIDWSKDKPSGGFKEQAGHKNPDDKPYPDSKKFNANNVKVGAFTLTSTEVEHLPVNDTLTVTEELLAKVPEDLKDRAKIDSEGRLFVAHHLGGVPDDPQPGDVRIRYKVAKPQTITVVAKQKDATFEPFTPEAGEAIDLVEPGTKSAQEMIASAQGKNTLLNWVLRIFSLLLMAVAMFLVVRRLVLDVADMNPESISFNGGVGVFAVGVAVAGVVGLIGVRWLFFQPLIGGGLMFAGLVVFGVLLVGARLLKPGIYASLISGGKKWSAEERELFKRTALEPENRNLRLELAADLEKKGEPMGEFIRIDNELEALPENDPRREPLDNRWGSLLQKHGRTWFAPLRKFRLEPHIGDLFYPSLWMHHGIIDEVTVDLAGILPEKAEQFFAAVPGLRVLQIHNSHMEKSFSGWTNIDYHPNVPAIVQLPQLEQIGVLQMSSIGLKIEDLKAIASSPSLKNLTELDVNYGHFGPEGGAVLAKSSSLKKLRVLELRAGDLGEQGAVALAQSPGLTQLISLNVGANGLGPNGVSALAVSANLKNLQTLALDENNLGIDGAKALAASPNLRQLTSLNLKNNELGVEGIQVLAGSLILANLTTLNLSDNKLGGAGVAFLASSPHIGRLKFLELQSNEIDDEGAKALAACGLIQQLEDLSLSYNKIGDAGFKALAAWSGLAGVKKLTLRDNKAGSIGITALAQSPHLRGLEELDLSTNEVGFAGAKALANSTGLTKLKSLWIGEAHLTPQGEELLRKRFGDAVHT